jgi:hypothetical protein
MSITARAPNAPVSFAGHGSQRLPAGNRAHTNPSIFVVRDPWKPSAQLYNGGQLTAFHEHLANSLSRRVINAEHGSNYRPTVRSRQAISDRQTGYGVSWPLGSKLAVNTLFSRSHF